MKKTLVILALVALMLSLTACRRANLTEMETIPGTTGEVQSEPISREEALETEQAENYSEPTEVTEGNNYRETKPISEDDEEAPANPENGMGWG